MKTKGVKDVSSREKAKWATSSSFMAGTTTLGRSASYPIQLASWFGTPPLQVHLADWISLQDDVTYRDLVEALDRAWRGMNLPRAPRSVDIITHSTGALVVRDWMTHFFTPATVPIMRLLMLAPANFGSPLAHTGQSFLSTIALKGSNASGTKNPTVTLALIQKALGVTDKDYQTAGGSFAWQQHLDTATTESIPNTLRMQNLITHVQDNLGQDVLEYLVQLYRKVNSDRAFEGQLYEKVIQSVHCYSDNPSYRSLYLSIDELDQVLAKFRVPTLYLSISANPIFKPPRQPVGYTAVGPGDIDGLGVPAVSIPQYFSPHRSLIVQLRIQRMIDKSVFVLR